VPHLQNPDRVASSAVAIEELATQLLLLDDGFQHRRLARDLDIVLLDASEPFGFDYTLPRGTLREPVDGLRRAGVVVLSRADMISPDQREAIRRRALELSPQAAWCEVEHRAAALVDSASEASPIESLAAQPVAAFCGIGNPAGFRHTLNALGANIVGWREFPDHHNYARVDVDAICTLARDSDAKLIVCTRKDLVKLRVAAIGGIPLRAIGVELRFLRGEDAMIGALRPIIDRAKQIRIAGLDDDQEAPSPD
jgi:tetraacyldisaccharide 4'-kinase